MKTTLLKKGYIENYSFRDLEYGLKVLRVRIDRKLIAIDEINKYNKKHNKHRKGSPEITVFEEEIEQLQQTIAFVEDEIGNRLLTGNDDGVVEKELLGANCV